ncbi:MAG: 50S ribosomal protein L25 [Pirellulales bacterium]|nr:50S ribosomal protein L25 [Pirellulales bacterium]
MAETLKVEPRKLQGKRNSKRLRRSGKIPAVVYGHGQEAVSIAVASEAIVATVRHGARVVQLQGAVSDSALIRELQFDPFGLEILHVDFARVSADERVHVKVAVEIKGQAQGAKEGGVVEHLIHEVEIECPVSAIPDKLIVNVGALKLDGEIMVEQIPLPEGVKLLSDGDQVAVHCVKPKEDGEEGAAAAVTGEGAEPELIRKEKPAEEEEES